MIATTVGDAHACALTKRAIAYCWGTNDPYLLGAGSDAKIDSGRPVRVAGDHQFRAIAAGRSFTCAVDMSAHAFCWGGGNKGQLGGGSFFDRADRPQPVAGGQTFVTIAVGRDHACALDTAAAAWCWGDNSYGQLGDSATAAASRPVRVAGNHTFSFIAAGAEANTTCGATATGAAFCWGANDRGQLGDGTTRESNAPVQVRGLADIVAIDPGADVSCALTSHHDVFCWGSNANGQLGLGYPVRDTLIASPTQHVRTGEKFTAVSAGAKRACAVAWNGAVYCWGSAEEDLLGTDADDSCTGGMFSRSCTRSPGLVRGNAAMTFVSVGPNDRICGAGRHSATPVYCWGRAFGDPGLKVVDATVVALVAPAPAAPVRQAAVLAAQAVQSPTTASLPAPSVAPASTPVQPPAPTPAPTRGISADEEARGATPDDTTDADTKELGSSDAATRNRAFYRIMASGSPALVRVAPAVARYAKLNRAVVLAPVLREIAGDAGASGKLMLETAAELDRMTADKSPSALLDDLRLSVSALCEGARSERQDACLDLRDGLLDAAEKLTAGNVGGARAVLELTSDHVTGAETRPFALLETALIQGNIQALLKKL